MFSKAILALPLLGLVQARPFLHDNALEAWVKNLARDDSTCAVVTQTITVDETVTVTATSNNDVVRLLASCTRPLLTPMRTGHLGSCDGR